MVNYKFLLSLFLVIFFVHILGMYQNWYWSIPWLDIPMHFFGGFWIAIFFLWFRKNTINIFAQNSFLGDLVVLLGWVALIGVFWEFFEYFLDYIWAIKGVIPLSQVSITDTLKDLLMDLLGGALAFFLQTLYFKK